MPYNSTDEDVCATFFAVHSSQFPLTSCYISTPMKTRGPLRRIVSLLAWACLSLSAFAAGDASRASREFKALVDAMLQPPPVIDLGPMQADLRGLPILPPHRMLWSLVGDRASRINGFATADDALVCFATAYERVDGGIKKCERLIQALGDDPTPSWDELGSQVSSLDADPAAIKDAALRQRYEAGQIHRRFREEYIA